MHQQKDNVDISYIGAPSALESLMGLILPLALIAAVLLLMTTWKPSETGQPSGKAFLTGALVASAAVWTIVWGAAAVEYTERSDTAAAAAQSTLQSYGLTVSSEDALDLVQARTTSSFTAESAQGRELITATWEDEALVLYSTGYEGASLPRVDR